MDRGMKRWARATTTRGTNEDDTTSQRARRKARVCTKKKRANTTYTISLQNHAAVSLVALGPTEQRGPRGVLEHLTHTLACPRRAFQIVLRANLD